MPDFPHPRPSVARNAPWLLRDSAPPSHEMKAADDGHDLLPTSRMTRRSNPIVIRPLALADRVQDVARRLTDDFVNGRTDIHFDIFRNRSRILWRRVARLRRAHRIDLLS
ncbi:hypothetical protein BH10PSE13_BH10PSE13_02550 [soil metagenome]